MNCTKCGAVNAMNARFCMQCGAPLVPGAVPPAAAVETSYAGFWIRVVAVLIDVVALMIVQQPINSAFSSFLPKPPSFGNAPDLGALISWLMEAGKYFAATSFVSLIIGWMYYGFLESSSKQGSLGKMALGLKVADMEGRQISFGRASLRYAGSLVSAVLLYVGYLMAAFTEKKQTLHDMIAGTVVIKEK